MAKVKKVQITIDENLLERIDNYASDNYMSRSGLLCMATAQFLNANEVMGLVKDMSLAMRKIADTGNVDSETMQQLEDFERISKMLLGSK